MVVRYLAIFFGKFACITGVEEKQTHFFPLLFVFQKKQSLHSYKILYFLGERVSSLGGTHRLLHDRVRIGHIFMLFPLVAK